jgi:hypothetical protein
MREECLPKKKSRHPGCSGNGGLFSVENPLSFRRIRPSETPKNHVKQTQ